MLKVNQKSIGLQRVTAEPFPVLVDVKKGQTTSLEIGVITSGSISARVAVFAPKRDNGPTDRGKHLDLIVGATEHNKFNPKKLEEEGVLEAGLIEISNGKEVLRQLTGKNGIVMFDHLRPGPWTVHMSKDNLPLHHYIENAEIPVQLGAGDKKEVAIRILPRLRSIRFVDKGVIR